MFDWKRGLDFFSFLFYFHVIFFPAIHFQLLRRRKFLWGGSHASSHPPATLPSPWRHRLWPTAAEAVQWPWGILQQWAVMRHSDLRGPKRCCSLGQRADRQRGSAWICTDNSSFASSKNVRAASDTLTKSRSCSAEQGDWTILIS